MNNYLRKTYMTLLGLGTLTAIAAMSGWMGGLIPGALLVGAIGMCEFDHDTHNNCRNTALWGGVTVLALLIKVIFAWTWLIYIPLLVTGYMGLTAFAGACYDFVNGMFRS